MQTKALYRQVAQSIDKSMCAVLVTTLDEGAHQPKKRLFSEQALSETAGSSDARKFLAQRTLRQSELAMEALPGGGVMFAEPYIPAPKLIVFGGGHIALPFVEFAAKCGFSVTVADDRPAFANRLRFPLAAEVLCEGFDRCFEKLSLNRFSFVVIITRGHRHDALCLKQTFTHEVAYVGMIGSARRVQTVKNALLEEGYTAQALDKVCSPIGLKIGAVTPEEIAVSILAEVILYKRTLQKASWPELDHEVLAALVEAREAPFAIATVVDAKGSVPRGIGAKMLVWPDGRTLGSIGGGCSEGAIIQQAYEVIRTGVGRVEKVDLSGAAAEDEGMVCGGRMLVVIERYEG